MSHVIRRRKGRGGTAVLHTNGMYLVNGCQQAGCTLTCEDVLHVLLLQVRAFAGSCKGPACSMSAAACLKQGQVTGGHATRWYSSHSKHWNC
jgi:hypothetical protein